MKRLKPIIAAVLICFAFLVGCGSAYSGLDTLKGLDIYAFERDGAVYFGLTEGFTPALDDEGIAKLSPTEAEKMKDILASYNLPIDNLFLYNETELSDVEICEMLGLLD